MLSNGDVVIPPLLISVFALPGKILKLKIAFFLSHAVLVLCQTLIGHWLNLFSLVTHTMDVNCVSG